jgi:plasmid stabilization system protein ParE
MLHHLQHELANHEADQVFEYLVSHAGFDVAERFLDALSDAVGRARTQPLLYRTMYKSVRRVMLEKPFGEYYLPFILKDSCIIVLAVAHASRKPFYWKTRIKDA